jgi:hypothetical protein
MGRLIAFLVGAAAIMFFGAYLLPEGELRTGVLELWEPHLDPTLLDSLKHYGAGLVAAVGLLLFATRGGHGGEG